MVSVTFVTADGAAQTMDAAPGDTLMEVARFNDVTGIEAVCGGNSYCGTCCVLVDEGWRAKLAPKSELERELLESLGNDDPSARLSCQIKIVDELEGLLVKIPEFQG